MGESSLATTSDVYRESVEEVVGFVIPKLVVVSSIMVTMMDDEQPFRRLSRRTHAGPLVRVIGGHFSAYRARSPK